MPADVVAAQAEAQISAEHAFAVAADGAVVSSGEAAVGLRTEAEVPIPAVEVAALLAEAQIPVEEGTASETSALRSEVEVRSPAAEQEELRTRCIAAAVRVLLLLHWPRLRTGRSGSVHALFHLMDQTDCLMAAACLVYHRDQLRLEPRTDCLEPAAPSCLSSLLARSDKTTHRSHSTVPTVGIVTF